MLLLSILLREVAGEYVAELRNLAEKILEMVCEGLGLATNHFSGGLSGNPVLLVNHYPPCPNPSLTLGLAKHRDPSLITILLQEEINGLQVFKDDEWIRVEPLPHALVVNVGYVLQVNFHILHTNLAPCMFTINLLWVLFFFLFSFFSSCRLILFDCISLNHD